ncbi:hypothetical protein BC941DRAFT_393664 [Chlamydoabsidia padenii]|nr:hypothetical protein BC941DRAFT_393664 [Chlamydoabsidia padenii]
MGNISLVESSLENGFNNDMKTSLQHETAIPATKLTQSNPIIPQQLLADIKSGGRERAALATVFGVPEYSESKILWERQQDGKKAQEDIYEEFYHEYRKIKPKDHQQLTLSSPLKQQQQSTFTALPTIPTVSRFNDLLVRDEFGSDLMFPSNASSDLLPSSIRPTLHRSDSSGSTLDSTFTSLAPPPPPMSNSTKTGPTPTYDTDNGDNQVSTPLIFIDYPPTVFDLLKPDDDDRIILWGPDPKTPTTSGQPQDLSNSSSTTTQSGNRPFMRGFSSNTTTSVTASRNEQGLPRILSGKLTDGLRKTLKSNSLGHHSSAESLKTILLLKRTFGGNKLKYNRRYLDSVSLSGSIDQLTSDTNGVNKVIEAASVEKLVEKLTNTLDYEFMTDFFLTYRSFISPTQLCKLFILRFRWALENDNEDRRIVRIRTFVVMRHWLLNYFVHDFIPTRNLRVVLTNFLNALPSHPLVKSSPRDQRIVKGLKRVVRRLKRVYYNGTHSQERVHVIAPPPPSQDQGHIEEMVRANLAHGLLGRKAALVRGVDVGGQHNGNMAVQDATRAPMVVVGNLHHKTDFQQLQQQQHSTLISSDPSLIDSKKTDSIEAVTQPNGNKASGDSRLDTQDVYDSVAPTCQESAVSDDSLESTLSPGTTEIVSDENYFDDDDDDAGTLKSDELYQEDDSGLSLPPHLRRSNRQQHRLERERRRREEEEERKRAEFFSTSNDNNDAVVETNDKERDNGDGDLSSEAILSLPIQAHGTFMSFNPDHAAPSVPMDTTTNSINDNKDRHRDKNDTRRGMDLSDDQAATLTTLELIGGPIRKAAIGDMSSRIRRVPSRKWCQVSADEETPINQHTSPPMPTEILPKDLIHRLDLALETSNNDSQSGTGVSTLESQHPATRMGGSTSLSRRLSRKSIERRKSERCLRELATLDNNIQKSASTPSSPQRGTFITADTPALPPLPRRMMTEPLVSNTDSRGHLKKDMLTTATRQGGNIDDFEAIPYEQTVCLPSMSTSSTTRTGFRHRRGFSKKLVNMVFSRSTTTTTTDDRLVINDTNVATPVPSSTTSTPSAAIASLPSSTTAPLSDDGTSNDKTASLSTTTSSLSANSAKDKTLPSPPLYTSTLVSRIAQELHDTQANFEIQCDCVRCTGTLTGPRACQRFSMALLADNEKRYSMELRLRRGASIDKGSTNNSPLLQQHLIGSRSCSTPGGPMYLGQLGGGALSHSDSDINIHIEEINEQDGDTSDSDTSTTHPVKTHRRLSSSFTKWQQSHFSNGSMDRLTGIATKGAGTSIHRQSLSGASLTFSHIVDDIPVTPLRHSLSDTIPTKPQVPFSSPWDPPGNTTTKPQPAHSSFILSYSSVKLAQQLCFIERDVLLGVDWEEMVHCRWTKMATSEETTRNNNINSNQETMDMRDIRQFDKQEGYGGIEQVIERFNTVCQWVASEIVSADKLYLRVKVVEKFIRLAQKCRMYSNFATLVQILLGLQSPSVSRLKRTWARVGAREQRLLDELSQFTSPMRNWKHIRDNMTMVADEYGMSPTEVQVEMPGTSSSSTTTKGFKRTRVKIPFGGCIPFLGIYLSDLVFNSEQPPYLQPTTTTTTPSSPVLAQPLVNFRKHRITATVIKRVLTFQNLSRRYAFDVDEDVYAWCLLLDPLDIDTIRRLSHALE